MQRRAAAAYAAFFLVLAAGAYGMIGMAQEPAVTIENPDYSKSAGDTITIDDRAYTVGEPSGGSVDLTWVNESERKTTTISNGSELSPTAAHWSGQAARHVATLANGTTIEFEGNETAVRVASGDDPTSFALVDPATGNETASFEEGDTFAYRGNETTVSAVAPSEVTLVWGDPYRVLVGEGADPSTVTFRQVRNVGEVLSADPAVENETVTRADGRRYVVYREDGRTQLLSEYLPPLDEKTFSEGETFVYEAEGMSGASEVTIANVTTSGVVVRWRGPVEYTLTLEEGETIDIGGTSYATHFDDGTLKLTSDVEEYRSQVEAREYYGERINGLWGISILGVLAAIGLLSLAYLPSRY